MNSANVEASAGSVARHCTSSQGILASMAARIVGDHQMPRLATIVGFRRETTRPPRPACQIGSHLLRVQMTTEITVGVQEGAGGDHGAVSADKRHQQSPFRLQVQTPASQE